MSFFKSRFFTTFIAALTYFTAVRFSHLATPWFKSRVTTPTKWRVKASVNGTTVVSNGTAEEIRKELQMVVSPPYQNVTEHLTNLLLAGSLRPSAKQFDDTQCFRPGRWPACFVQLFDSTGQEEATPLRNVSDKPIDDNSTWLGEREMLSHVPKAAGFLSHDKDDAVSERLRTWTCTAASAIAADDATSLILENCAINISVSKSSESQMSVLGTWKFSRERSNGQIEYPWTVNLELVYTSRP